MLPNSLGTIFCTPMWQPSPNHLHVNSDTLQEHGYGYYSPLDITDAYEIRWWYVCILAAQAGHSTVVVQCAYLRTKCHNVHKYTCSMFHLHKKRLRKIFYE